MKREKIISVCLTITVALQAWMLSEIVNLKVESARLSERVDSLTKKSNEKNTTTLSGPADADIVAGL